MQSTHSPSKYSQFDEDEDREYHPEKLIDDAMVFKAAMTSEYSKITDLSIIREGVTNIDPANSCIRQMSASLRRFDLAFNHIRRI